MARTIEHADDDVARLDTLGSGHGLNVFGGRLCQVDDPLGIAGTDGQLVHIDVGRIEQAPFLRRGQHRQRVGTGLGGNRRAFERVKRNIDLGALALRPADLFADEEHGRLVAFAFADDDRAIHVECVEGLAHRFHGCGIGSLLVAAADEP